ncbi:hypothetical protein [Bacteroides acidifaciens]|nr:hypothetical protein [Bacteroides acidifaciens]
MMIRCHGIHAGIEASVRRSGNPNKHKPDCFSGHSRGCYGRKKTLQSSE